MFVIPVSRKLRFDQGVVHIVVVGYIADYYRIKHVYFHQVHTIAVLEFPPKESCSSLVSLEFLYGI